MAKQGGLGSGSLVTAKHGSVVQVQGGGWKHREGGVRTGSGWQGTSQGFSHPELFEQAQVCVCSSIWGALQGASQAARWESIPRCGATCGSSLRLNPPKVGLCPPAPSLAVAGLCVRAPSLGTSNSGQPFSRQERYSSCRAVPGAAVPSGFGHIPVTSPGSAGAGRCWGVVRGGLAGGMLRCVRGRGNFRCLREDCLEGGGIFDLIFPGLALQRVAGEGWASLPLKLGVFFIPKPKWNGVWLWERRLSAAEEPACVCQAGGCRLLRELPQPSAEALEASVRPPQLRGRLLAAQQRGFSLYVLRSEGKTGEGAGGNWGRASQAQPGVSGARPVSFP